MRHRLALHTWTLDSTPLPDVLRIARDAGWPAIELRRIDFARAAEKGQPAEAVLDLVRRSGLTVACVGGQLGWMFSDGAEQRSASYGPVGKNVDAPVIGPRRHAAGVAHAGRQPVDVFFRVDHQGLDPAIMPSD